MGCGLWGASPESPLAAIKSYDSHERIPIGLVVSVSLQLGLGRRFVAQEEASLHELSLCQSEQRKSFRLREPTVSFQLFEERSHATSSSSLLLCSLFLQRLESGEA